MAAVQETITRQTEASFTITLASLATSTAGAGRQSTLLNNSSNYPYAQGFVKVKLGTSPSAGLVQVYLIQGDDSTPTMATDSAGATNAAITILGARLIASSPCKASPATGDLVQVDFDTRDTGAVLAPYWGIAVVHSTGVNLDSTEGNHLYKYQYYQTTMT